MVFARWLVVATCQNLPVALPHSCRLQDYYRAVRSHVTSRPCRASQASRAATCSQLLFQLASRPCRVVPVCIYRLTVSCRFFKNITRNCPVLTGEPGEFITVSYRDEFHRSKRRAESVPHGLTRPFRRD